MAQVEIWIAMNEDGDAVALASVSIGEDMSAEVADLANSDIGGAMLRIVKIPVRMSPPEVVETAYVSVSDDAGATVKAGE